MAEDPIVAGLSHLPPWQKRSVGFNPYHMPQVDPALQLPGSGRLIHVDLAAGSARRLGGSCLAQVFQQVCFLLRLM